MKYTKNTWDQLKGKTADDFIRALLKDGFELDAKVKTERIYRHPDGRRVSIHYHKGSRQFGRKLIKGLLDSVGWAESDMRKLGLIK